MKTCRYRKHMEKYSDGEIRSAARVRAIEDHLQACEACRRELASLAAVRSLIRAHGSENPPADFIAALQGRIEATVRERVEIRPRWTLLGFAGTHITEISAALTLALSVFILSSFFRTGEVTSIRDYLLSGFSGNEILYYTSSDIIYKDLFHE